MFRALMGGGGRDDTSSRSSRRKAAADDDDSRSSARGPSKRSSASSVTSSRKSTRGDDRDRGLGDLSGSRSVTGESAASTYVTAEPGSYVDEPIVIERTPRYAHDDDDRTRASDKKRDPERDRETKRKERKDTKDRTSRDSESDRYRDGTRGERTRTRSGDDIDDSSRLPSTSPGTTAGHFAAEITSPGFSQFPMQYDAMIPNGPSTPNQPLDSHVPQQFPGQFPTTTAEPYFPPNPAGLAADYYGDQGQSVAAQPGVRPRPPDLIVGAEPHLLPASPIANPPPEPSSLGQVGASADYYGTAGSGQTSSASAPASTPSKPSKPGKISKPSSKPSKPSKPSRPSASSLIQSGTMTYGIGSEMMNHASSSGPTGPNSLPEMSTYPISGSVPAPGGSSSHQGVGMALGAAAAGAAAGYAMNHYSQSASNQQSSTNFGHISESYGIGLPSHPGSFTQTDHAGLYAGAGYNVQPSPGPPTYSSGLGAQPGSLAHHRRHHGPLSKFMDFWRDPEGVGRFEDYTEAIGVCKYCFEPGTTSRDAPRKHYYNRRRKSPVVDRYGSSTRIDKLNRYASSEDESRRTKSRGSSWLAGGLAGGLAGYVSKSLFQSKDFDDTYSIRSGSRIESRRSDHDGGSIMSSGKASSTSRGVIDRRRRRNSYETKSTNNSYPVEDRYGNKSSKVSRRHSRSRSRSISRERRPHSHVKEAALGAAVGALISHERTGQKSAAGGRRRKSKSPDHLHVRGPRRRRSSSPKGFTSFFTAPSANRRKRHSKKTRGFFSFSNSSSSSGDHDLAFGGSELSGPSISGRSSRSSKRPSKSNVDAEILGLGLAARELADSSSRKGLSPRDLTRPSKYPPHSGPGEEDWEDADSEDSLVSENMAYGGSELFGSRESLGSGPSFWPWQSNKKESQGRQPQHDMTPTFSNEHIANAGAYGIYDDRDAPSSRNSLNRVYPIPTNDHSRFDEVRMSTSSSPNAQPPLVLPGPIPLQQPQPFTPVSQSFYDPTREGRGIPADSVVAGSTRRREDGRNGADPPRRRNSSPVLPTAPLDGTSAPSILKRSSTTRDSASVSFDLTDEQADRERKSRRREQERLSRNREEAEEDARRRERKARKREERRLRELEEAEEVTRENESRQQRDNEERRKAGLYEKTANRSDSGTRRDARRSDAESSSWTAPVVAAVSTAAVAGIIAEQISDEAESKSSKSYHEERRQKRRSERRHASEHDEEVAKTHRDQVAQQTVEDDEQRRREERIAKVAASRIVSNSSPAHESYEDFFLPEELKRRDEDHSGDSDSGQASPRVVEIIPATERFAREMQSFADRDTQRLDLPWTVPRLNLIEPTPPASHDGSVRDVHSPVPTPEPTSSSKTDVEEPAESVQTTARSRVSWGEHQTHEYEVATPLSERDEFVEEDLYHVDKTSEPSNDEPAKNPPRSLASEDYSREESNDDETQAMPGSFGVDSEFAATLAAGAAIAGFDPSVVTDDAKYYRRDSPPGSELKGTYRAPMVESVENLGNVTSKSTPSPSQQKSTPRHFVEGDDFSAEPDVIEPRSSSIAREVIDQLKGKSASDDGKRSRQVADVNESFAAGSGSDEQELDTIKREGYGQSVASAFISDTREKSKKPTKTKGSRDSSNGMVEERSRSASSSDDPGRKRNGSLSSDQELQGSENLGEIRSTSVKDDWKDDEERPRRRKSKDNSDRDEFYDDVRSVAASTPGADELEDYKSSSSKGSSKHRRDTVDDDSRSLPDVMDEDSEPRKRRHRKRHSSGFDDTASVVSSPAKIDESREKRRSRDASSLKDGDKGQDKKSGGFLSNIFGSRSAVDTPSADKRDSRDVRSEAGVDDDDKSERRRKKKSSGRRSSSGEKTDAFDLSSEPAMSTPDLSKLGRIDDTQRDNAVDFEGEGESHKSRRERREQKRRDKYEQIVDSGRDTSKMEEIDADDNGRYSDEKQSFLGKRPEMPPTASSENLDRDIEGGASGPLASTTTGAAAAGLVSEISPQKGHDNKFLQQMQRYRSHSVSPEVAEKTIDLPPKSRSRPTSPHPDQEDGLQSRPFSMPRLADSPTAVPLHFRKPPVSPSSSKRLSMSSPAQSPSSPVQGHRHHNSGEFIKAREIRPLWLVSIHSSSKNDPTPESPLPSLPSSKTTSRSPSIEDLREGSDAGFEQPFWQDQTGQDMGASAPNRSWWRGPTALRVSTDSEIPQDEHDYLNSQEVTPTAETYREAGPPPIKKEKPKYEFHSPSELLQDPSDFHAGVSSLPLDLDPLPSIAGSQINDKEAETSLDETSIGHDPDPREISSENTGKADKKLASGRTSFLTGLGIASVVDAAVSAAVKKHEVADSGEKQEKRSHVACPLDETDNASEYLSQARLPLEDEPTGISRSDDLTTHQPAKSRNISPSAFDGAAGFGAIVDAAVTAAVGNMDDRRKDSHHGTNDGNDNDEPLTKGSRDTEERTREQGPRTEVAHSLAGMEDALATQLNELEDQQRDSAKGDPKAGLLTQTAEQATADDFTPAFSSKKQRAKQKKEQKKKRHQDLIGSSAPQVGPLETADTDTNIQVAAEPVPDTIERRDSVGSTAAQGNEQYPAEQPAVFEELPKESVEDHITEHSADNKNIEKLDDEAVGSDQAIEGDPNMRSSSVVEQADTNDDKPHMPMEPADDSWSMPKSRKEKKKNDKKGKRLSATEVTGDQLESPIAGQIDTSTVSDQSIQETQEGYSNIPTTNSFGEKTQDLKEDEADDTWAMSSSQKRKAKKSKKNKAQPLDEEPLPEPTVTALEDLSSRARHASGTAEPADMSAPTGPGFVVEDEIDESQQRKSEKEHAREDNRHQDSSQEPDALPSVAATEPVVSADVAEEDASFSQPRRSKKMSKGKQKKAESLPWDEEPAAEYFQKPLEETAIRSPQLAPLAPANEDALAIAEKDDIDAKGQRHALLGSEFDEESELNRKRQEDEQLTLRQDQAWSADSSNVVRVLDDTASGDVAIEATHGESALPISEFHATTIDVAGAVPSVLEAQNTIERPQGEDVVQLEPTGESADAASKIYDPKEESVDLVTSTTTGKELPEYQTSPSQLNLQEAEETTTQEIVETQEEWPEKVKPLAKKQKKKLAKKEKNRLSLGDTSTPEMANTLATAAVDEKINGGETVSPEVAVTGGESDMQQPDLPQDDPIGESHMSVVEQPRSVSGDVREELPRPVVENDDEWFQSMDSKSKRRKSKGKKNQLERFAWSEEPSADMSNTPTVGSPVNEPSQQEQDLQAKEPTEKVQDINLFDVDNAEPKAESANLQEIQSTALEEEDDWSQDKRSSKQKKKDRKKARNSVVLGEEISPEATDKGTQNSSGAVGEGAESVGDAKDTVDEKSTEKGDVYTSAQQTQGDDHEDESWSSQKSKKKKGKKGNRASQAIPWDEEPSAELSSAAIESLQTEGFTKSRSESIEHPESSHQEPAENKGKDSRTGGEDEDTRVLDTTSQVHNDEPGLSPENDTQSTVKPLVEENAVAYPESEGVDAGDDGPSSTTQWELEDKPMSAKARKKLEKEKRKRRTWQEEMPSSIDLQQEKSMAPVQAEFVESKAPPDDFDVDTWSSGKKKKGKKNKRWSVDWEDEVTGPDAGSGDKKEAEAIDATPAPSSYSEGLVKQISAHNTIEETAVQEPEATLQETPIEVDGKEFSQSFDKTDIDKMEVKSDWTDDMVSSQVQPQKEESPYRVPSPISTESQEPSQGGTSIEHPIAPDSSYPDTTSAVLPTLSSTTTEDAKGVSDGGAVTGLLSDQPADEEGDGAWTIGRKKSKSKKRNKNQKTNSQSQFEIPDEQRTSQALTESKGEHDDVELHDVAKSVDEGISGTLELENDKIAKDNDLESEPLGSSATSPPEDIQGSTPDEPVDITTTAVTKEQSSSPKLPQSTRMEENSGVNDNSTSPSPAVNTNLGPVPISRAVDPALDLSDERQVAGISDRGSSHHVENESTSIEAVQQSYGGALEPTTSTVIEPTAEDAKREAEEVTDDFWEVPSKKTKKKKKGLASLGFGAASHAISTNDSQDIQMPQVETEATQSENTEWKPSKKGKSKRAKRNISLEETEMLPDVTPMEMEGSKSVTGTQFHGEQNTGHDEPKTLTASDAEMAVSLDPFDGPETADDQPSEFPILSADGNMEVDTVKIPVSQAQEESQEKLRRRTLEKEDDLAVAEDLFGDTPRAIVEDKPLSRESSKKKGKGKGKKGKSASLSTTDTFLDPVLPPGGDPETEDSRQDITPAQIEHGPKSIESWPSIEFGKERDSASKEPQMDNTRSGRSDLSDSRQQDYEGQGLYAKGEAGSAIGDFEETEVAPVVEQLSVEDERSMQVGKKGKGIKGADDEEKKKGIEIWHPSDYAMRRQTSHSQPDAFGTELSHALIEEESVLPISGASSEQVVREEAPRKGRKKGKQDFETDAAAAIAMTAAGFIGSGVSSASPTEHVTRDFSTSPYQARAGKDGRQTQEDSWWMSNKSKGAGKLGDGTYDQKYNRQDSKRREHTSDTSLTAPVSKHPSSTNSTANVFPGLERVTFRRPSPKTIESEVNQKIQKSNYDRHDDQSGSKDGLNISVEVDPSYNVSVRSDDGTGSQDRSIEIHWQDEHAQANNKQNAAVLQSGQTTAGNTTPSPVGRPSKDRSSSLHFNSSPSSPVGSSIEGGPHGDTSTSRISLTPSGSIHRTKSIHGTHSGPRHSWKLENDVTPSQKSLGPSARISQDDQGDLSPPRTPLDTIREHDGTSTSPSPRLTMGHEPFILPRPESRGSAGSSRSLRRANRSISADLRAASATSEAEKQNHEKSLHQEERLGRRSRDERPDEGKRLGHVAEAGLGTATDRFPQPHQQTHDDEHLHLEQIPSSSTYDPVTDKGKRPLRGMTDVYEAWGETPNSPRSPTRPASVRRRQSMQQLQELETRLDQLISENRLLAAARDEAEQKLTRSGIARRKSDQALNRSDADLRDKEAEIARLERSLEWMEGEMHRLTQENETLNATHTEITAAHAREVDGLRTRQVELATGMEGIVREQISASLAEKDAELRRLRDELAAARQTVQELQQQIVAATADDVLAARDEDYFDNACQRLCQHVQQWVLRFSKHSDLRRCRPLAELRDPNVADRFDNAILDGSDVDAALSDRVRRRDVFMAVVMAMIWEYIFTRYMFGMDREQRQKLKALEKQLSEVGPRRAVSHWRGLTLTLLAKRATFAEQRARDTEAVALEIMGTLSQLLPPPQTAEAQLLDSLRGVLRRAADLSIEMRTQRAEYMMLPPLQPEYDAQGELARQVVFNASLMNERSGATTSNEELEAQGAIVRLVLFPLVVKKGNDFGDGDDEIVVCPAQVLIARPEGERTRDKDRISMGNRSVSSVVPSLDMGNMI